MKNGLRLEETERGNGEIKARWAARVGSLLTQPVPPTDRQNRTDPRRAEQNRADVTARPKQSGRRVRR
ncbi:hypothetical protein PAAG_12443 [Paracoccidioides lutzii Pb01]|uniref:Uncharacterized protein n=1 Tax=Paracoccidioides lutzii (strain ATCC MYA-826 / Pb01) TaxID=502779 RepID=A0A0A2V413_PARBA|nr:hypothetical protein PAAG_12443 [Paracoccidioides lutzii Pb01]KGQ00900.1 hypothetical protein PAAG_12443 [Paracoccidioides lutzii Pb01]